MNKETSNDQRERLANHCVQVAEAHAALSNMIGGIDNGSGSAIAILIKALEMLTPDLSPERRASLFLHQEN